MNEHEKNPAAVALGRLGGLKGGKARAAEMTPERRSEIARNAARARWGWLKKGQTEICEICGVKPVTRTAIGGCHVCDDCD